MAEEAAAFDLAEDGGALALRGDWTVDTIAAVESRLHELDGRLKSGTAVDVSKLGRMDMAGAYVIDRTLRAAGDSAEVAVRGEHKNAQRLLATARKAIAEPAPLPEHLHGLKGLLERIGRAVAAI